MAKLAGNLKPVEYPTARPPREECLADDKSNPRAEMGPVLREAKRGAVYAEEYAANYIILYEGDLEDDDYAADSNDMQVECDEIVAAGRPVNPSGAFVDAPSIPPHLGRVDPDEVAASLRLWATRPTQAEVGNTTRDPIHRGVYNRSCMWEAMVKKRQEDGPPSPPHTDGTPGDHRYG